MLAQFTSILDRIGDASCYFLQVAYRYPGRHGLGKDRDFSCRRMQICQSIGKLPKHRQQSFRSDPHLSRAPGSTSNFQDIKIGKNERYLGSIADLCRRTP